MSFVSNMLPARLKVISDQVRQHPLKSSNIRELQETWKEHVTRVLSEVPAVHIEADGEVLHTGSLSPGCRICKEGAWDCAFLSMECNLDCGFCCSPHAGRCFCGSAFGAVPEQIMENQSRTRIAGVSFSGGEPFADPEKLLDWVARFKSAFSDRYYWVYTNGLLAVDTVLRRLGELGLDEIRFNTAATGYDHPDVMRNMSAAAGCIPKVTVEIPAIPGHAAKLLGCLGDWCSRGARYLNLHELLYEPGTNSALMPGNRSTVVTADGHVTAIDTESRTLTLEVMRYVQDNGVNLSVNDCSLQSKLRQLRGRRRSLAPLVRAPYEKLLDDLFLESCCAYRNELDFFFFHPDDIGSVIETHPGYSLVRLARIAPLSIRDPGRWVSFREV